MLLPDIMSLFSQLVFPVAVAAYLLWERAIALEKLRTSNIELKIAIYLVLEHLDLFEDFQKKMEEHKKMKEEA